MDGCSAEGDCLPGQPLVCNLPKECELEAQCDPGSGVCRTPTFVTNGTGCTDGSACTLSDSCLNGQCFGASRACNDGNVCTSDACDPAIGCTTTNLSNTTPCDDGLACTSQSLCTGSGVCTGSPSAGSCVIAGACYANNATNPANGCQVCKVGTSVSAWSTLAEAANCDDGTACTTASKCVSGVCQATAQLACDDQKPCTDDTCDPVTGCKFTHDNSNICEKDGKSCTLDSCSAGECVAGPIDTLSCLIDGTCHTIDARPGAPHTTCAVCDPFKNQTAWTHEDQGLSCDVCRTGATCQSGFCKGGSTNAAADGLVCAPAEGIWAHHCSEGFCWAWTPTRSGAQAATYTPPAGCLQIAAQLWGGGGGSGGPMTGNAPAIGDGNGGFGGYARGMIPIAQGDVMTVFVGAPGGRGDINSTGGAPGGGHGAYTGTSCTGGGGGGYSAVWRVTDNLLVAGGGGGGSSGVAGGASIPEGRGGSGGGAAGGTGERGGGISGGGGTETSGGIAGLKVLNQGDYYQGYYIGNPGSKHQGGDGHVHGAAGACSGGGGGGGWFGGGGGATWIGAPNENKYGGGGGGGSGVVAAVVLPGTSQLVAGGLLGGTVPPYASIVDGFDLVSVGYGESRKRSRSGAPGLVILRCEKFLGE